MISQFSPTHLAGWTIRRKELDVQHFKIKSPRLKLPCFGFPSPGVTDCRHLQVAELRCGNLDHCCFVQSAPPPSPSQMQSSFTRLMAKEIFTPSSGTINIFALSWGEGRN